MRVALRYQRFHIAYYDDDHDLFDFIDTDTAWIEARAASQVTGQPLCHDRHRPGTNVRIS